MSFSNASNGKQIKCNLCYIESSDKQITILDNCKHKICNMCLKCSFTNNWASILKCPIKNCDKFLENVERENIRWWILPIVEPVANHSNVSTLHVDTAKDVELSYYYPKTALQKNDLIPKTERKEIVQKTQNLANESKASNLKTIYTELYDTKMNKKNQDIQLTKSKKKTLSGTLDKIYGQPSDTFLEDLLDATDLSDKKLEKYEVKTLPTIQTEDLQNRTISKSKKVPRQNYYEENGYEDTITTESSSVFNSKVKNSPQSWDTAVNQNSLTNHDQATHDDSESYNIRPIFEKEPLDVLRHKVSHSKPSNNLENSCDTTKTTLPKELGVESMIRLQKHIKEKNNKVVDVMFVALESDLALNTFAEKCLICKEQISTYEGIVFPHCSRSFCRTCLVQPHRQTELADEIIILYSISSNNSKNCAIVINAEIRSLLTNPIRFAQFQEDYVLNTTAVGPKNYNLSYSGYVKNPGAMKVSVTPTKYSSEPKQCDTRSDVVLLRNSSISYCYNCSNCIQAEEGVILRDCCHVVCDICLIDTIMETLDYGVEVSCPSTLDNEQRCKTIVQEREIKRLLTEKQYEKYERKCLEIAQGEFDINVNCFNTNCNGCIIIEGYKDSFVCPVCFRKNCLACKADHHGRTCNTYRTELGEALSTETNPATTKSRRETRNGGSKRYDQYY